MSRRPPSSPVPRGPVATKLIVGSSVTLDAAGEAGEATAHLAPCAVPGVFAAPIGDDPVMTHDVTVTDVPDRSRYEATIDGEVAGFAEYLTTGPLTVFTHTEVGPAYEGKGVGSALARFALDDMRAHDRRVLPVCPFIKDWIGRHPDYAGVIYHVKPSTVSD